MKMLLCDFKNKLIEKFGYDDKFAEDIAVVADSLEDYLGEIVYEAILSCRYIIQRDNLKENLKKDLKEAGILNLQNLDIFNNSLGKQSFYLSTFPSSNEDGLLSSNLINPVRVIVLPSNYNFSAPLSLSALVKETIKLVFSYFNEYTFENNILKQREGLCIKTLNRNSEKTASIGEGLENGIVLYLTEKVMRNELSDDFEIPENDYEKITAGYLLDNIGLNDDLIAACLSGETEGLKEMLNSDYESLITILDSINRLEKQKRKSVTNPVLLSSIIKRIDREFGLVGTKVQAINDNLTLQKKSTLSEKKIS